MKMKNIAIIVFSGISFFGIFSCNKKKQDFDIVYEVEFVSTWSQGTHPTNFPSNAHMSPLIGISHTAGYEHYKLGEISSAGVKSVAETGNTSVIESEFNNLKNSGVVLDIVKGEVFDSPGTSEKAYLGLDPEHSNVTVMSMIAPSPDWFVGVKTSLKDASGAWVENLCVRVSTYDGGTDSGATFTSPNMPISPYDPIDFLREGPLTEGTDTVMNMGYFNFKRIK